MAAATTTTKLVTKPTPPPAPPPAPPRMTLAAVTRGRLERAPHLVIYGQEGTGKSTLGSHAPEPIFLDLEDGTAHLDVPRFPRPETWPEVLEAIDSLRTGEHGFRTLVIDTADRLEALIWAEVCKRAGKQSIEEFGFGGGYTAALDEWRLLASRLDGLRTARGVGSIILAHSHVKTFKNPEAEDFDRYEMKLHQKAGSFLREWADAALFARFEVLVKKGGKNERARGVDTGDQPTRMLCTQRRAAFDAKNRLGLPPELPLSWGALQSAITRFYGLRESFEGLAAELPPDLRALARERWLEATGDHETLEKLVEKARELVKEGAV